MKLDTKVDLHIYIYLYTNNLPAYLSTYLLTCLPTFLSFLQPSPLTLSTREDHDTRALTYREKAMHSLVSPVLFISLWISLFLLRVVFFLKAVDSMLFKTVQ